jgi:hypothetical protein
MDNLKTYSVALRAATCTRQIMETNDLDSARETFEELIGWYSGECDIVLLEKFWELKCVTPLNLSSLAAKQDRQNMGVDGEYHF